MKEYITQESQRLEKTTVVPSNLTNVVSWRQEGIKYKKWNCFTVQFHPEANGGPKDTEFLFDRFLNNVKAAKKEAR